MNETKHRLWGIDVIAGIYGLVTLLMIWIFFNGTGVGLGRQTAAIIASVCAVLSIGIAFRFNPIRIAMTLLLALALVGDSVMILYYVGALADVFQAPANIDPFEKLMKMPFRIWASLVMFFYLRRADVVAAFHGEKNKE